MSIGYMNPPTEFNVGNNDVAYDLTLGAGVIFTKTATFPCEVYDFFVKTTVATTGPCQIALRKTPLNGTQSANLATITIPTATPAGVIFRNVLPVNGRVIPLQIGDTLTVQLILAPTAGEAGISVLLRRSQQPILNAAATPNYNEVAS